MCVCWMGWKCAQRVGVVAVGKGAAGENGELKGAMAAGSTFVVPDVIKSYSQGKQVVVMMACKHAVENVGRTRSVAELAKMKRETDDRDAQRLVLRGGESSRTGEKVKFGAVALKP
jgi:hypothetical protein